MPRYYCRRGHEVKSRKRKTDEFFVKSKGLHSYFERNGGSLASAIANANHSMDEKEASGRYYTYSELGRLMEELKGLEVV